MLDEQCALLANSEAPRIHIALYLCIYSTLNIQELTCYTDDACAFPYNLLLFNSTTRSIRLIRKLYSNHKKVCVYIADIIS